ncbi:MAG TPA: M36 family metallopeptidase, partial [Rudaea sp.]
MGISKLACALGATACVFAMYAATPAVAKTAPKVYSVDVRVNLPSAFQHATAARQSAFSAARSGARSRLSTSSSAYATLHRANPALAVSYSTMTGSLAWIVDRSGWLTSASQASSEAIVRAYLSEHRDLFGLSSQDLADLTVLGDSHGGHSGLRMLRIEQRVQGRPVFQSESRFLLSSDGRLAKYVGQLVPAAHASAPTLSDSDWMAPAQAVAALFAFEGRSIDAGSLNAATAANGRVTLTGGGNDLRGPVSAQRVWFPLSPGLLVPAWQIVAFTAADADWNAVIDAQTGDLLWRKNMRAHVSSQDARFSVYVQADGVTPADSPAPHSPTNLTPGSGTQFPAIARTNVSMHAAMNATASPNGWINDGGTTTTGNNVDAYLDTDADNLPDVGLIDNNGRPVGNPDGASNNRDFLGSTPRDYSYQPAPQAGNPDAGDNPATAAYRRGVVTNLFYVANWYHDQLVGYGFDEASGNFQQTNFSGMGAGGDPVLAEAQDGSGTDNSNFATPPDGLSGRMQMYIFDFPTPKRDGSLDGHIMLHELTHGLSNRLIGNGNGLTWDVGGGMGEGWSDFYALSLTNNSNTQDPDAPYAFAGYATYQLLGLTDNYLYGLRRFPYSTDNTVNPLTWADVDDVTFNTSGGIAASPLNPLFSGGGALEVHNVGEIWALSLWEVRARVIADPAGANGDVPAGNAAMLQLTTDALKMTPINPSFLEARDALIDADCATNACANEASIWGGFADRGLGYGATAPSGQVGVQGAGAYVGIGESFAVPNLDVASIAIDDSSGNNNGAIDPGEPIRLTVTLTNPWRRASMGVASASATLSTSTSGVGIVSDTATYGAIAAQGTAAGNAFAITVPSTATCGQALHFTLSIASTLGTISRDITVRVGADAGDGATVTYTHTISGGLAVPDDNLQGVTDTLNITDDFQINKVQFRIDSLTHTFTSDLVVSLKGPNGYGDDYAYLRGAFIGDGDGDNFTNTVFDDASSNDLNRSGSADAPFTGDWLPAFNSPIWSLFGIPNLGPDPVGELSRFSGLSSAGNWRVHVADEAEADTGQLNAWSLIVTPKAFTCAAFTPVVTMTATQSVSGTFIVGNTVTYSIVLTNTGSGLQADNSGHEFTEVLPASLTLVTANATSGSASTAGNTIHWDGALAPLGGSVTITVTATINSGAQGTTVSAQGLVSYDANVDGTNEATLLTDDPAVGGSADPTVFSVGSATVAASETVAGAFTRGGAVSYTVTLTNGGSAASPDNAGHEFAQTLPAQAILASATASSGTATVSGQTVNWDGSVPAGGSVTITIAATVDPATPIGATISTQGTLAYDADLNGSNESSTPTDDPSVGGNADPTAFVVQGAHVTATKTVAGKFKVGNPVTYTIVLHNDGNAPSNNASGNEVTDALPAGLVLVSVNATSGTAAANLGANAATWDGSIAAGASVTITITATIAPG